MGGNTYRYGYVLAALAAALCLILSNGCALSPRIVAIDRNARQLFSLPCGEYRDIIQHADTTGAWSTLTRSDARGLLLRERGHAGQILNEVVLPVTFHSWYDSRKWSLSPDRKHFIYQDDTGHVRRIDLVNNQQKTLRAGDKTGFVDNISFCTTQAFVTTLYTFEGPTTDVLRVDSDGCVIRLHTCHGLINDMVTAPKLGLVAFVAPQDLRSANVWLWDIVKNTSRNILNIPAGFSTGIAISPHGKTVCVLIRNDSVMSAHLVDLDTNTDKIPLSIHSEDEYWRSPAFMGEDSIVLVRSHYSRKSSQPNTLEIYNAATGELL